MSGARARRRTRWQARQQALNEAKQIRLKDIEQKVVLGIGIVVAMALTWWVNR